MLKEFRNRLRFVLMGEASAIPDDVLIIFHEGASATFNACRGDVHDSGHCLVDQSVGLRNEVKQIAKCASR
jgi:hypothetical protein